MPHRPPLRSEERTPLARLSEGGAHAIVGYQLAQAAIVTNQVFDERVGQRGGLRRVEFTILALAKKIIAMTGSRSKIVFKPLPSDDPTQRQPDIGLAKQKLGWQPKVTVDEGFKTTIDYFKKELAR